MRPLGADFGVSPREGSRCANERRPAKVNQLLENRSERIVGRTTTTDERTR
jgi:hypothetical protein